MLTEVSEKLFYDKFCYKVILRQVTTETDFKEACAKAHKYCKDNLVDIKVKNIGSSAGCQGSQSICFNGEDTLRWLRINLPDHLYKQVKPVSQEHEQELLSCDKIRVRPLFFKKFRYLITFSRFKARQLCVNLGERKTIPAVIAFEHGEGELQAILSRYNSDEYHIVTKYDVTIYCNSRNLAMQLRMKYSAIISEFIFIKTPEELVALA